MSNNVTNIDFKDGSQRIIANGYEIRWNPNDINFVDRFFSFNRYVETDLKAKLEEISKSLGEIVNGDEDSEIDADAFKSGKLEELGNEFNSELDKLFGSNVSGVFRGANPLSPVENGNLLFMNFLEALTPFIKKSIQDFDAKRAAYVLPVKNTAEKKQAKK